MRALNIAAGTFTLCASVLLIASPHPESWVIGMVLLVPTFIVIVGNIFDNPLTDRPPAWKDLPPEVRPDAALPVRYTDADSVKVRRRCGHTEKWEPVCDDCLHTLASNACVDCYIKHGAEHPIIGCDNCPQGVR
jgi:hypothetical protein